jgi:hypothetical protein
MNKRQMRSLTVVLLAFAVGWTGSIPMLHSELNISVC